MTIQNNKLTRDYKAHPICKGEVLPKSDLEYLYFEENLSLQELCAYFNCKRAFIRRNLEHYNLKKEPTQYNKNSVKTMQERYGVSFGAHVQGAKEKAKKTCIARYGVDNVFKDESVKDKIQKTNRTKYGVDNPMQNYDIRTKAKNTMYAKYKTDIPVQTHINNIEIYKNKDKFIRLIKSGNNGKKWTSIELSKFFNISTSHTQKLIADNELWYYMDTHTSKEENEIRDMLESFGLHTTKHKINGLELDIYIPEKKVAIEFNGNYWHSTTKRPDIKYHFNKSKLANDNGIFVYHIFEYTWYTRREQVINQLKNILQLNTQTIFARKCEIKEVDFKVASKFLDNNHIQGSVTSQVYLGLHYNTELVSLMTFSKSRFNKKVEWELVRFCSKAGTNVVGGASKLFKHFVKMFKPQSVISYSDIAHTKGGLYPILGFTTTGISDPNYVWVHHNNILTRHQCTKANLIKQGFGTLGDTEDTIMRCRNYVKVFDCGCRVHIWYNKINDN